MRLMDLIPAGAEKGAGLIIIENGYLVFQVSGQKHTVANGERFYAGIGGHLETGETFIDAAKREAVEEIGTGIELKDSKISFYVDDKGDINTMELDEKIKPFLIYEMIHPEGTPCAGKKYHIVSYLACLADKLIDPDPEEVSAVIAMKPVLLKEVFDKKTEAIDLLNRGAKVIAGEIDEKTKLYPLGTARSLGEIIRWMDLNLQEGFEITEA